MLTKAIVVKKKDHNEHDQLVTLYSPDFGKADGIAKSILKNGSIQKMHLDIFNCVELELVSGRSWPIITGAQAENTFPNLKANVYMLAGAYFFTETIDKMFYENQKDDKVWSFLKNFLEECDYRVLHNGLLVEDIARFIKGKQSEFLQILGYMPELNQCSVCAGTISESWGAFNGQTGGAVCQNCFLSGHKAVFIKDLGSGQTLSEVFQSVAGSSFSSVAFLRDIFKGDHF